MTAAQFLAPITASPAPVSAALATPGVAGTGQTFGDIFRGQLAELDRTLKVAETQSMQLASGEAASLHQVMLGLEKARIAFQLSVQIRNRLMEGWQDLQRMQL